MVYSIEELKDMARKYISKQVKKKDLGLKRYDLKVFNKIVELIKLQNKKVINRQLFRVILYEFLDGIDLKVHDIDYLRDVIDLYNNNNTLATRSNKPNGEINTKIVGSKDKRVSLFA